MTVREALSWAVNALKSAGVPSPEAEAEYLVTSALRKKRHELFLDPEKTVEENAQKVLEDFIGRRARREPSQYITGEAAFMGLSLKVTPDVLIPRPETEVLVSSAIETVVGLQARTREDITVVDLCTGSGCIAVAMARELARCRIFALDSSAAALSVAKENAGANGVAEKIAFLAGDLYGPLRRCGLLGHVDLIVSNPPYVARGEMESLEPEVRDWEPPKALIGGEDGLDFFRRIIKDAPFYLVPGGYMLLETGFNQADKVISIFNSDGRFEDIGSRKDLSGIERVVKARRKR